MIKMTVYSHLGTMAETAVDLYFTFVKKKPSTCILSEGQLKRNNMSRNLYFRKHKKTVCQHTKFESGNASRCGTGTKLPKHNFHRVSQGVQRLSRHIWFIKRVLQEKQNELSADSRYLRSQALLKMTVPVEDRSRCRTFHVTN